MREVKRYSFDEICDTQDFNHEEKFILASDYEHLKTKLELTNKELRLNILSHLNDMRTLEKLKAQLERAEEVIEAYANAEKDQTISISIPYDDLGPGDFDIIEEFEIGEPNDFGEKAREYFKKKEQV